MRSNRILVLGASAGGVEAIWTVMAGAARQIEAEPPLLLGLRRTKRPGR